MSQGRNEIKDLWAQVRTDGKPLRWVVAKGNEKLTDLEPAASGNSGLSGLVAELKNMEGILFGGIRVAAIDERGTVTSIRPKFIKFMLITSSIGGMKRAKAQGLQVIADDIFQPTHCSFNIDDISELTPQDIQRKLHLSAGAHLPNRYEFEGREENLDAVEGEPTPQSPPSSPLGGNLAKVAAEHPVPSVAEAAAEAAKEEKEEQKQQAAEKDNSEASAPKPAPSPVASASPTQKGTASPPKTTGSPVTPSSPTTAAALSSVADAWNQVQNDKAEPNYLVIACEGRDEKSAKVVALANGDLKDFKEHFDDDQVMFGGFRMRAIDDRGSVLSIRTKFIFVSYIGRNVRPLLRANAGTLRSRFEQIINGCHVSIAATEQSDIDEADITAKLLASGGAHSPNNWDYSGKKDINNW